MKSPDPLNYAWWLASRSAGIVAFLLVSASVILGLAMAAKLAPARTRARARGMHEQLALASLVAIALHGVLLLGDHWLRAGVGGVLVPFVSRYRPFWTGTGIVAAYLAALLGLSFYVRRRIGARRWRSLHRLTIFVYVMAAVHVLGAGSDASTPWMRAILIGSAAPIAMLLALRMRGGARPSRTAPGSGDPSYGVLRPERQN